MGKRQPISLGLYPWIADTVHHLATNSNPAVIFQFREELLAERVKQVIRDRLSCWAPRVELLRAQREDGTWESAEGSQSLSGRGFFPVAGRLLELHDLGVRKDSPKVKRAVDYLAGIQEKDGSFPLNLHQDAFVLWILAMYGFGKTAMAKRILKHLELTRRKDSGWLDPELEPALAEDEDSPSCPWTTLHVLLALTEYPDQRRDMDVRRAAVFLLDRMFKRNLSSFFGHPDHWHELDYGYEGTACFKWAVPKVLLILGRLGCGPETNEVADLLAFLRKTLRPNGRWGASLEGNDFLTLRILRALKAVQLAGSA